MTVISELPHRTVSRAKEVWHGFADSGFVKSKPITLMVNTVRELGKDDATQMAAGVAYYAFFSLFPMLLGLMALMGIFLQSQQLQQDVLELVGENFPGSSDFIKSNISNVVRFRGALGVASIVGLLWSASAVFGAIGKAMNRAWEVPKARPFYLSKVRQIGMAFGVGLLGVLSVSATSFLQLAGSRDLGIPGEKYLFDRDVVNFLLRLFPSMLSLTIFLLVYKFIPDVKTYWRHIWIGAVIAAVLFEVSKNLFVWYLNTFASYDQVYGTLASVIVLLFWAYISALILILGAEISSEYAKMEEGVDQID